MRMTLNPKIIGFIIHPPNMVRNGKGSSCINVKIDHTEMVKDHHIIFFPPPPPLYLYYEVRIVCLSVYLRFTLERLKLDPQTHIYIYIYLESVSPGERHEHVYMATPLLYKIKAKNDLCQKKMELHA